METKPVNAFKRGSTILVGSYKDTREANRMLFNNNWQKLTQIKHNLTRHRRSPVEHPEHGELYFRYAQN
jgi:hypothetical protein